MLDIDTLKVAIGFVSNEYFTVFSNSAFLSAWNSLSNKKIGFRKLQLIIFFFTWTEA